MELTVLGCGDAFGNGGRNNTSFLLTVGAEHVLIDCGTTTLLRLKHEGVPLEAISTVFISHFHGDHFGGIPFLLISSLFENPRKKPLKIVGPEGVRDRVLALQEIMYPGTTVKLEHLSLEFIEYHEGAVIEVGEGKAIEGFRMEHSPESNPHGFRLIWENKVVAFSGDTSMTEALFKLADEADLFICECNFMKGVNFGHLSYEELQQMEERLNCKQLWLSHMNDEVFEAAEITYNRLQDGLKISF